MVWRQKHTQFPGPGPHARTTWSATRLWPTYAVRPIGLFFLVAAVLVALGGLVQINPIWLYGPYRPAAVTTAAQPDWYMGWMEGALRLMPPGDLHVFGYTVAEPVLPGVLLPGLTFALLYLWPVHRAAHSPVTATRTTCSTGRATGRGARRSGPRCSPSTRCCSWPGATTCWPPAPGCRSTP